jgi:hypothetical protein
MYRGQETGDRGQQQETGDRRQSNEKSEARAFGGVGVIVELPGEGDVTALPLFHRGAES